MREHLVSLLGGMYPIYDSNRLRLGEKDIIWPGCDTRGGIPGFEEYVSRLDELAGKLARYVKLIRFWAAPLEADRRVRERVEAAIIEHLRTQPPPAGELLGSDLRCRPRKRSEPVILLRCRAAGILGMPAELKV